MAVIVRGINTSLRGKEKTMALAEVCAINMAGWSVEDPSKHKDLIKKIVSEFTGYMAENYTNQEIETKTKEYWVDSDKFQEIRDIVKEG